MEAGDIDGYLAGMDAFEAGLQASLAASARLSREEISELAQIDRATRDLLASQKEEVAGQLAELARARLANSAYLAAGVARFGDDRQA